MTDLFVTEANTKAREAAYAAVAQLKPEPTSVVEYSSRGHVIVIANSHAVVENLEALESLGGPNKVLSSEIIQFEGSSPNSPVDQQITIKGALGQFEVCVGEKEFKADLILDLSPNPILDMAYKPPGYISTGTERVDIDKLTVELEALVGTFEKPLYVNYDANICAHGRSGKKGCTRCIDACPAEAITSLLDKIEVDTSRCHGGGICATVCPSSALTYAYPKPKDMLQHVRTLILTYLKETDNAPGLVFVTEEELKRAEHILPAALFITVEEVASVGVEVWLSALAWGASSINIFTLDGIPETAQQALGLHLKMAQKILVAMNYPANVISIIDDSSELITRSNLSKINTATHAALSEKRQAFYMALDHLVDQAEQFHPSVLLPVGSIFGEATIDQTKCTLCMSCVSACPGNALQDGREMPQVSLIEEKCLQCNVCVNTCPEDAISISPRLLLDKEARQKPRVLHQDEPFCCTKCGKPFATTSGIATIMTKLAGHSMFADERSRSRLKMCDDCRVVDMMEDPNTDF